MEMKALQLLALLSLGISLSMEVIAAEKEQDPWSLRIVPTRSSEKYGVMIDCASEYSYFYVVLTNTSGTDLSVWREWCSWGYFCLTFKITLRDGKTIHVKKRPRPWSKNYPDPFLVKSGDHFVYSVRFSNKWEGFPVDWQNQKVKIKAIFKIEKEDADTHKVWTGKIMSPEIEASIYK